MFRDLRWIPDIDRRELLWHNVDVGNIEDREPTFPDERGQEVDLVLILVHHRCCRDFKVGQLIRSIPAGPINSEVDRGTWALVAGDRGRGCRLLPQRTQPVIVHGQDEVESGALMRRHGSGKLTQVVDHHAIR